MAMSGTYRAIQLTTLSKEIDQGIESLSIQTLPRPTLKSNQIRVQIYATAVNYFDLLIFVGRYQHKPKLPTTVGSESSGVVIEIGSQVSRVKVGDAVIIGMSNGNANAEEMVIEEHLVLPKPKTWTHVQAAGVMVGFLTGYHGLVHRGQIRKGEYLLVTGAAGGMGLSAIQLGKKLGAIVIATASDQHKLDICKKLGADYTINYTTQKLKEEVDKITKKKGVDVVYELVGGDIFDQCSRIMAGGGRLLVVGFASGKIPSLPANLALVKGFSLVGVRSGMEMLLQPKLAQEMWQQFTTLTYNNQELAPYVESIYSLEHFKQAYHIVNQRKVVGKAVIQWKSEPVPSKL